MSHADFVEIMAHYALQDPEKKLEKEIEYQFALEEIERDRASRRVQPR